MAWRCQFGPLPLRLPKSKSRRLHCFQYFCLVARSCGPRLLAKHPHFAERRLRCEEIARTMKLFRTAFWLGVVVFNLPNPASQPGTPGSQPKASQGLTRGVGNLASHSSSRDSVLPSQDTLTHADRAAPWHGPSSGVAPIMTSKHCAAPSSRACI
jgi:hypothetical protein